MERRILFGVLGTALLFFVAGYGPTAEDNEPADHHGGHFAQCARACTECLRECESCAHHCAHEVAMGNKDHLHTLGTCADCADMCGTAAKVAARQGPMASIVCDSCAKACDTCGAACEKFPDDEHMAKCAKTCRDCAKACKEMIEHLGHNNSK
jgi:hypothetical protein